MTVAVGVRVGVGVNVGVAVTVGVGVTVGVSVAVGVEVGVSVTVAVGVVVAVDVGVGVTVGTTISKAAPMGTTDTKLPAYLMETTSVLLTASVWVLSQQLRLPAVTVQLGRVPVQSGFEPDDAEQRVIVKSDAWDVGTVAQRWRAVPPLAIAHPPVAAIVPNPSCGPE